MMNKQPLLNTYVNNVDMEETVNAIEEMIASGGSHYIVPVNVDVIVRMEDDHYLRKIAAEADMVLVDGKPLIWIAAMHRHPVKAKISGSDLVPRICEVSAKKGYSIFIIGGAEGIAARAKRNLESRLPSINIVGTYAPPMGFEKDAAELSHINHMISLAHPDIVIACFGCPKQEKWIYENYLKYNAKVSICAGATVDFLAGNVRRAPKWMSDAGLEWLFRISQDPKRLFKRYFVDDMRILGLIHKYRH